jgi:YHS domain-containing protein
MPALISRRAALLFAALITLTAPALAAKPEIYLKKGWQYAIGGADAVAYQSLAPGAAPVQGSDQFTVAYKGATWRFASAANRDAFAANPVKYAPQYGGYCAWALARNKLAAGDPAVWFVKNGKVYLNINKSIQKQWLANIDRDIANGDRNWPGVLSK